MLVRAAYRTAGPQTQSEWLALGRRSIANIERIIAEESDFGDALKRCGVCFLKAGDVYAVASPSGGATLVQADRYTELLDRAVTVAQPPRIPDPEGTFEPYEFPTPGVKTIAQVAEFSGRPASSQIKSLVMVADGRLILVLLRGDHQLSGWKFASVTRSSTIRPGTAEEIRATFGAEPGSLGPVGVSGIPILADTALDGRKNMISGANRNDYHLKNVTPGKDFHAQFADLRLASEGDTSPDGGALRFLSADIVRSPGDILEAAAAQNSDTDGLTLPCQIAPFSAVVTPVHPERLEAAREIYKQLVTAGVDALLDDRDARPGVKFKDADLIGFPCRINVGKKFVEGLVEFVVRHPKTSIDIAVTDAVERATRGE